MKEYHKIQSIFKRDEKTNQFLIGEWAVPEIGYLSSLEWQWDEKIDGTNIRIIWDGSNRKFGGRTDNAQIPAHLYERLEALFTNERLKEVIGETPATLYGEGFGAKIQGGGDYLPHADFILFDIFIDEFWLKRDSVEEVAKRLNLRVTNIVGKGTIEQAIEFVKKGFNSSIGTKKAEGLILRPLEQLFTRRGHRIITKIKTRDFKSFNSFKEAQ